MRKLLHIILAVTLATWLGGCAGSQAAFKGAANEKRAAIETLTVAAEKRNEKDFTKRYVELEKLCEAGHQLHDNGKYKQALSQYGKAEKFWNEHGHTYARLKFANAKGSRKCISLITHYDYRSEIYFIFDDRFEIDAAERRRAVGEILAVTNPAEHAGTTATNEAFFVLQVKMKPRTIVSRVSQKGDKIVVATTTRGWLWPTMAGLVAGPDMGFRLNRADRYRFVDYLRFIAYVNWIPKIIDVVGIARGKVGVDYTDRQTLNDKMSQFMNMPEKVEIVFK